MLGGHNKVRPVSTGGFDHGNLTSEDLQTFASEPRDEGSGREPVTPNAAAGNNESYKVVEAKPINDAELDEQASELMIGAKITLKEQLDLVKYPFSDRNELDKKRREAYDKMRRKLLQEEEDKKLKDQIITFYYATDRSLLRRSSPEDVWAAIQRREAWRTIPFTLVVVSLVQIGICTIVMIAKSAPVNGSTLIMAAMYVVAMATSNPFSISGDLTRILQDDIFETFVTKKNPRVRRREVKEMEVRALQAAAAARDPEAAATTGTGESQAKGVYIAPLKRTPTEQNRQIFFMAICVLLSPLLVPALGLAYGVTAVLDFTTGPILDVSFANLVNILVNIVVVFSALSIGLRSEDPISAIQTFVGFDFVNSMDEVIIGGVDIDLMAHVKRSNDYEKKILAVRVIVYIGTALVLGGTFYLTIFNECFLFCNGGSIVV